MVVECSGPRFESLVNPFTGKRMVTKMSVTPSGVMYFAPDEYSPYDYFPTASEAHRAYTRVNGVEGLRTGDLKCPYTGERLVVVRDEFGFRFSGGFDPKVLRTRDDWMYRASMRDGVSQYPEPGEQTRVTKPPQKRTLSKSARRHLEESETKLTDESVAAAEDTLVKLRKSGVDVPGSSTVSMHMKGK